ncbi:DNA-directed RNA polymerase I subunit RPA2-like isoform X1 [Sinocyclocheilus grahami]|uniref:DNA-directed RNA polymerase I subunit RPA2-like isoform X1 n=1 Tax=Sinocyclocheilus grahami TaxID=75366 RepID=UPI0007AC9894|nr:PREDICTED: DNA-directed RNA polymerase I subunit RPA2-like isoform X1 [Sinocyclocheilus grahami]XP_016128781.1 PREDICTED: DNA-directed RNA polymerase I subunit RPA2-like isoform X1 [Sinocyclocheilus grahami]
MSKQTMGFPLHSYQDRSDNKLYHLQTPQSPLVRPAMYDHYDMDNYPIGTNAIVAVIFYIGYDMEDAMIVNKSSWERGFAHGSVYKTELIDLSEKVKGDDSIVFGVKPGDPKVMDRLDADGLPFIGSVLKYGDPYYSYINLNTGQSYVNFYKTSLYLFIFFCHNFCHVLTIKITFQFSHHIYQFYSNNFCITIIFIKGVI